MIMITPHSSPSAGSPRRTDVISTVRYSLPELLAELQEERMTGAFAQEKLHQTEIAKLFETQPKRRRAKSSQ